MKTLRINHKWHQTSESSISNQTGIKAQILGRLKTSKKETFLKFL